MSTILITGANRSLGFEAARRLIEAGHDVWIGARDEARGRAAAEELGARFVQLDVTDDASVAAAVETVGALDVLVNNAGIPGELRRRCPRSTVEHLQPVFEVNVFGPVRVLQAFRPLLEQSSNPVVVNVSSGMGSIGVTSDPDRIESTLHNLTYGPSKTALNMLTTPVGEGVPELPHQRGRPGLHRHRLQPPQRPADRRGGHGRDRRVRADRPRRPDRRLLRPPRRAALVNALARRDHGPLDELAQ